MQLSRRSALIVLAGAPFMSAVHAQAVDPRMGDRALGPADAKIVVNEWFSMTCSHCAEFQKSHVPARSIRT